MEGIIVIDKPKGISSFDVIRKLRKILKIKKIGHTGTLDPLATGLMLICVGKATKLASELESKEKTYKASFEFGYLTDSLDSEGKILKTCCKQIDLKDLEISIKKFIGDIKQVPPMYSALKINGKKLYELARKGIEVEREERNINVKYINLISYDNKIVNFETRVSKGCYIRSLINDIALDLGTYATMTELRRLAVGEIEINSAYTLDKIEEMAKANDFSFIKSVEESFDFPKYFLDNSKQEILFLNGNTVKLLEKTENSKYRIYFKNKFLGLGEVKNNILLKAYKYY